MDMPAKAASSAARPSRWSDPASWPDGKVPRAGDAVTIAEREAERLREGDDELTCVVWCWIARSTAELLRPEPGIGERIH